MSDIEPNHVHEGPRKEFAKLSVQPQLQYPLCVPCSRVYMNSSSLKLHLEKKHGERPKGAKSRVDEITAEAEKDVSQEVKDARHIYKNAPFVKDSKVPIGLLPALEGVEKAKALKCPTCEYYVLHKKSMAQHIQKAHKKSEKDASDQAECSCKAGRFTVQSLQGGSKTCFFRVHDLEPTERHDLNVLPRQQERTVELARELPSSNKQPAEYKYELDFFSDVCEEGPQHVELHEQIQEEGLEVHNDFIAATRVPNILEQEGIQMQEAARLTGPEEGKTSFEKDLSRLSQMYLEKVAICASNAAPALLETLCPREDKSFQTVGKNTVKRYSQQLSKFLAFAFRCLKFRGFSTNASQLLNDYVTNFSSMGDEAIKLGKLHNIMKELCLVQRSKSAGVRGMFVRKYFACICVCSAKKKTSTTYRFAEAAELSHSLAAMQHFILGTALIELQEIGESATHTLEREVVDRERCESIHEIEERILSTVSRSENTALSFVRIILNICWGMKKKDTADFKFIPCKAHEYCGFIRGVEVSLPFLGQCIRRWQEECDRIMRNELLCGGSYPPDLQDTISRVDDNLQDKTNGYAFLDHPSFSKTSGKWQKWLMREMAENGLGGAHVFARPMQNDGRWTAKQLEETVPFGRHRLYRTAVERWLGACQRLQEKLLLCLHISSGSPARATEISTFRLQNSALGPRNIYLSQNELVTLCRYSKMRKQQGSDTHILRVPDAKTGFLFKVYFLFFRRLESMFVGKLYGDVQKRAHMHWCFVNRGERFSPSKVRTIIWGGLAERGKELGISDIRHFFAEMVRAVARFSVEVKNELIEEFEDTGHAQAGHSTEISDRHYGRSMLDFVGLSKRSIARCRLFCAEWHECLFLSEDDRNIVLPRDNTRRNHSATVEKSQSRNGTIEGVEESLQNIRIEMRDYVKRALEEGSRTAIGCNEEFGEAKRRRMTAKRDEMVHLVTPKPRSRERDAKKLLPSLRILLNNRNANFKSPIQADVSASVLEASEDMLVLMGTGSGKSLCVLLPVFMEGAKWHTVIITPLSALVVQWKKKCEELGISTASWQERKACRVQVYVFAAEHVDTCEYRLFVRTLSSEGLLRRIVYDEAHGVITWDDFRPSMFKARFLLGCVTRPIQRVLLSATVPPFERNNLLVAYGMREAYLFAAPTTRNNLGFSVKNVRGSAIGDGMVPLLKGLSQSLKEELERIESTPGTIRVMIFVARINDATAVRREIESCIEREHNGAVLVYHGQLTLEEKMRVQFEWISSTGKRLKVIICTAAFGAGIDARNILLIFHLGGSSSLVQYVQECGRAARGGEFAKCIVLWNEAFARKQEALRRNSISNASLLWEKEYEERKFLWWNEVRRWVEESEKCRRASLFTYVDGIEVAPCFYEQGCSPCDVCCRIQNETLRCVQAGNECIEMEVVTPCKKENRNTATARQPVQAGNQQEKPYCLDPAPELGTEKPGNTMVANHIEDRGTREDTLKLIARFEETSRRIDGLCVVCLVLHGAEKICRDKDRCETCSQDNSRCYKCLSSEHRCGDCNLPRYVKNHCNRCGLNKLDGRNAHQGTGFAKDCPRPHLNHMFWLLWSSETIREQMLDELCTTSQRSTIRDLVVRVGPYAKKTAETVLSWLHNKTGLPMHVRVLCWWGTSNGKV